MSSLCLVILTFDHEIVDQTPEPWLHIKCGHKMDVLYSIKKNHRFPNTYAKTNVHFDTQKKLCANCPNSRSMLYGPMLTFYGNDSS